MGYPFLYRRIDLGNSTQTGYNSRPQNGRKAARGTKDRRTGEAGMHTVELLELALAIAEDLGYRVRQEWLGGAGGGCCEIARQKCLFVDISLNPVEQLDQVARSLREDPAIYVVELPGAMRQLLGLKKTA
jgi:hypothetical protein